MAHSDLRFYIEICIGIHIPLFLTWYVFFLFHFVHKPIGKHCSLAKWNLLMMVPFLGKLLPGLHYMVLLAKNHGQNQIDENAGDCQQKAFLEPSDIVQYKFSQ